MFWNKLFGRKKDLLHPTVLVMFDGWGLAPPSHGNAITQAKTPNMDRFYSLYPHGELIAAGESVGLPAGEVGNSEVGHLTAGVGRVIYQSLKRINLSIEHGEFYENSAVISAVDHATKNNSNIHIMGLVSSGNVHSSIEHLYATLQAIKKQRFDRVYIHAFTDGRDAPPDDGLNIIKTLEERMSVMKIGKIATISGRYYAMDRDARWERIQKVYDAMTLQKGKTAETAEQAMRSSYQEGKTDEFVEPVIITHTGAPPVSDGDSLIYFNFRVDRARELTMAFSIPNFENINPQNYGFETDEQKNSPGQISTFSREKKLANLFIVTMTQYQASIPASAIMFPPEVEFPDSLTEIISKNNMKQFHLAESEKERMVTYYFRGMNTKVFPGEDVLIVPSPDVPTYDKKPEMSAPKIVHEFEKAVDRNIYSFFVMNFANPDMVAHSGKIDAAIKAIQAADKAIGQVVDKTLSVGGNVVISADHGNAEELLSFPNETFFYTTDKGAVSTDHSSNPVPVLVINKALEGKANLILNGTLADIAPTILAIMNIPKPEVMQGRDLLEVKSRQVTTGDQTVDKPTELEDANN